MWVKEGGRVAGRECVVRCATDPNCPAGKTCIGIATTCPECKTDIRICQ